MSIELKQYLAGLANAQVPLWIDAWQYGQQLLNKGRTAPWDDVGALVSYQRQLQGLVNSDVVSIQADDFYQHWLETHPALKASMGEKRRLGYALRTLLAAPDAKAQLLEIVNAMCDCYPNHPVVLVVPSPKRWMELAYCTAQGTDSVDISWEDAESASMYMADFLRTFSDTGLSGILLRDEQGEGPCNDAQLEAYRAVYNTAGHYRWAVILDGCSKGFVPAAGAGVSFTLGDTAGEQSGLRLGVERWDCLPPVNYSGHGFLYLEIPASAIPEQVLELLSRLRSHN